MTNGELLLGRVQEWLRKRKIHVRVDDGLSRDDAYCGEGRIAVSPHFRSATAKAITLLHEMGHLSQKALWSERQGLTTRAAMVEEEIAWLAAETLLGHLGYETPDRWEMQKRGSLHMQYVGHQYYEHIGQGRKDCGINLAFFERAHTAIMIDPAFGEWLADVPSLKAQMPA